MKIKGHILITGAAGFIGYHTCLMLMESGYSIIGFDSINSYYDVELKKARLNDLQQRSINKNLKWQFIKGKLEDKNLLEEIFKRYKPKIIVNLAAQAGVRYSKEAPIEYLNSNIYGFVNLLECCKKFSVNNFIYASSSSVYGSNTKLPFEETDRISHPISLYAATKRSNELIAHSYSHLYGIPSIGLRFFTVYGPWGRPDMAPMIFTKAIVNKKPLEIYNDGQMSRDFTYIDDVSEIILRLLNKPPVSKHFESEKSSSEKLSPYLIFNVGCSSRIKLLEFINILENEIGIKAIKTFQPLQSGDVIDTFSDNKKITNYTNYHPKTSIKEGIKKFIKWYRDFYNK